jgi:hypothetical protein
VSSISSDPAPLDSIRPEDIVGPGAVSKQKPRFKITDGAFVVIVAVILAPSSVTDVTEGVEMETLAGISSGPSLPPHATVSAVQANSNIHPESFMGAGRSYSEGGIVTVPTVIPVSGE